MYKKIKILLVLSILLFATNFVSAWNFEGNNVKIRGSSDVNIISPLEQNGAIPINVQDQTTRPLDLFFLQPIGLPTTLQENVSLNDTSINVSTVPASCGVGDYIGVFDSTFYFGEILSISGTIIELDTPFDMDFYIGDPIVCTTRELNVDGSSTIQVFSVRAPVQQNFSVDITRILFEMTCTDTPVWDDFCDITGGLTKGIVLRKRDGDNWNIWNIKSNSELANLMYDVNVLDSTRPFNVNGIVARYTFAGQDKHGVAIRLEPNDRLELWIQDDLTSILSFRIIAEGHIVQN